MFLSQTSQEFIDNSNKQYTIKYHLLDTTIQDDILMSNYYWKIIIY